MTIGENVIAWHWALFWIEEEPIRAETFTGDVADVIVFVPAYKRFIHFDRSSVMPS